ncbi:MAG TPA: N-acetylmuramoyl-L-alanine amidase [Polyangiaceae bacterium]|jgi:N-acetyl-anhydromuramyl-L-alanine amidase AmpD
MAPPKKKPKKTPPPKKATAAPAKVSVQLTIAFSLPTNAGVVRWIPGGSMKDGFPVAKAIVSVKGTKISAKTTILGIAQLPIAAPVKGRVLEINPAASQVSSGPAGASTGASGKSAPAALFRPFTVTVDTDAKGFVPGTATVSVTPVAGSPPYALLLSLTKDKLKLDWKPDFLKSPNAKTVASKSNDFLVIHRTGGSVISGAINGFLNPNDPEKKCIHYLIDRDGHVVKLAHENDAVNHTGHAFWQGSTTLNSSSIGIENVNGDPDTFPNEQYTTLMRLVREIRAANASIGRQQVVGHVEIGTEKPPKGQPPDLSVSFSRRIDDPGELFEWDRLENAQLTRQRVVSVPTATVFGIGPGQFTDLPVDLKGHPTGSPRLFPKTLTPNFTGIQQALSDIGYSINAKDGTTTSGVFDEALHNAVRAFQRRYFSGGNAVNKGQQFSLGRIDFETAFAIECVLQDNGP